MEDEIRNPAEHAVRCTNSDSSSFNDTSNCGAAARHQLLLRTSTKITIDDFAKVELRVGHGEIGGADSGRGQVAEADGRYWR